MAQTIDTYYLSPEADGTNVIEFDGSFQHSTSFRYSDGRSVPDVAFDQYQAVVRYAHYIYIDGHPAEFQIIQPFDYASNWRFGGFSYNNQPGMRKLQAGGTTLSAVFWPYADRDSRTYVYTAGFVTPPDGSFSSGNSVNGGSGAWGGDVQFGVVKGFGANFSAEGAFDVDFHGSADLGDGYQRNIDPIYRIQIWANWDWGSGLRTSIGYTGMFGGAWSDSDGGATFNVPRDAEAQTIRGAVSYRWTPRLQTALELDHAVQTGGGYGLGIGVIGRVKVLF